jgi:hypothetical protein
MRTMAYLAGSTWMVKAVLLINSIGIENEEIDHINIFVGEYKWKS